MLPYFDFGKPDILFVPVWVRLPNLLLECWSSACLPKISNVIDKPIRCDDLTLSMSQVSFAKVMIEVDLSVDLPRSISLSMPDRTIISKGSSINISHNSAPFVVCLAIPAMSVRSLTLALRILLLLG